jgi:dihydroflavonol-4-reductase
MSHPYLITGASGFLGRHLLQARAADTAAIALVRDRQAWAEQDWSADLKHIELVQGSVTETADWADQLPPLAGIFHLAALVRHSRRAPEEVYTTNVEGSLNMVRLAAVHKCRLIMLSTSGTVGCFDSADVVADENAAFCEETVASWPYYHSKIVAEKRMRELADKLQVELVFIRPPMLLGPEDHRFRSTSNVLRMLRGRLPFLIHGGIHFIDIRDAAQAILRAMDLPDARPIYHLDGTCSSITEFFGMIEEVSGVRAPRWVLPLGLARLLAAVDESVGMRVRGEPLQLFPDPVVVEMASHYWGTKSLYAESELGYKSRDPMTTLRDTVDWLRTHQRRFN